MKAIVQHAYGPPHVLTFEEIDTPTARDDEVLVRVRAASVQPGDYLVMTGVPYVLRLIFGLRRPRTSVPGRDVAGHVEAVGGKVRRLRPGDKVFGWSSTGALADYASAREDHFALKPANLTMEQAVALPTSAVVALQALRDKGKLQKGQTVLITGASGGVGTFAVQIAKALGAEVTGVCSTRNVDTVRSIGADHVIDYTQTDFTRTGRRYDVILDNVEAQSLSDCRRALAPRGILIPNKGSGGRWVGPLGRIVKARARSLFTRQSLRPFLSTESQDDLVALTGLIEAGGVTAVLDRTYPLREAAAALAYVSDGHTRGKIAITV